MFIHRFNHNGYDVINDGGIYYLAKYPLKRFVSIVDIDVEINKLAEGEIVSLTRFDIFHENKLNAKT